MSKPKHFTPADSIDGVKGSKPRFKSAREELPQINRDYLEERTRKLRSQAFLAETLAREKAGELIPRQLVARQAQYIFICLRQSILNFPAKYARHVAGIADEHQVKAILTQIAHEFLGELANFSEKAIDPDWLQTLEGDGAPSPTGQPKAKSRPSTGAEIKREQERAKARRARKTQTMRNLRARKR